MEFQGKGILLDIEGTTSSIRFVYDEMFPFARRELNRYLEQAWGTPECAEARDLMAVDADHEDWQAWLASQSLDDSSVEARELVAAEAIRLMDGDVKATGLKQLQGLIWKSGFHSGELKAHLYDEVAAVIKRWDGIGKDVRIYSSGSIAAQKLFFGHTVAGDLLQLFGGHYDTTTGGKREAGSYIQIAESFQLEPKDILFLSDVVEELDAARAAGCQTALCIRPGNHPAPEHDHPVIESFEEIEVA